MGSCRLLIYLPVFYMLLLLMTAKGNVVDDFLEKVCEEVECGKGSCIANTSYPLSFVCECEPGWKRIQDGDNETYAASFLPSVIPECSLNDGCQPAPTPFPEKDFPHNKSTFDRTLGSDCLRLGIGVANSTDDSAVSSTLQGRFHLIIMWSVSIGMVMVWGGN